MCNPKPCQLMNEKHQETLKTKNVKRKLLSVNFDRCVRVTTIPHVKDFTKDEIKSVWYTQAEYDQTREDCFNIVRRMNRAEANTSGPDHPSSYLKARVAAWSTRGLESLGKAKGNIRRVRRLVATKAVLSEQHFQREEGSDDPDFISHLYQQISAPCQIEAHSIGLQDQNEAIQCYKVPVLSHRSTVHVSRLQRPSSCDRLARSY